MKDFGVVRGRQAEQEASRPGEEKRWQQRSGNWTGFELPAKLFEGKRVPLSVKDLEWHSGGQRNANTTECTAPDSADARTDCQAGDGCLMEEAGKKKMGQHKKERENLKAGIHPSLTNQQGV
jgi:hypothetical protein